MDTEKTATLIRAGLPQFCPVTNFYRLSDGRHVLVTAARMDIEATLSNFGVRIPIATSQLPSAIDVFLADAGANVLDADGDPSNGMTPLASYEVDSHAEALAELGYTEVSA